MKLLLEREEVKPDKPDKRRRDPLSGKIYGSPTPLSYATSDGYERVVKLLLERKEVNPDKPDERTRTPLSYAVWSEHENLGGEFQTWGGQFRRAGLWGVVKLLLEQEEVNLERPDRGDRTPLSYAASGGYEGEAITRTGRGLS